MSILDANGSIACAECGRKARDERDKLLDGFHVMQQLYEDELKHALAENVKLRELMSIMAYCNQFRRDCDGCSLNGAAGIITERAGCDELLARLRELGVEVD